MPKLRTLSLYLLLLLGSIQIVAQCNENIILSSQAEVDNFTTNYGCTEIDGSLRIEGEDITNLDGLSNITFVSDHIQLRANLLLLNVDGLNNITSAHGLYIFDNPILNNLDGLNGINSFSGNISIEDNAQLTNLDGLSGIDSVSSSIDILGNQQLTNIDGLNNITNTLKLNIKNNPSLVNIDGFNNLNSASIEIVNNTSLENIQGFNNIINSGEITITNNPNLSAIDGFSEVISVSRIQIEYNNALVAINCFENIKHIITGNTNMFRRIRITNNESLLSLPNFEKLELVGKIQIINNSSLTNIGTFDNLIYVNDITIQDNAELSECCVLSCLSNLTDFFTLEGNNTNCNSLEEIQNTCPIDTNCQTVCQENIVLTTQEEVDNFSNNYGCQIIKGHLKITGNDITNLDSLQNIKAIHNGLTIDSTTLLLNTNGLQSLVYLTNGPLIIKDNSALENLNGLENLDLIHYYLTIENNPNLVNIDAINNISTPRWVYHVSIVENDALLSIPEFSNLSFVDCTIKNNNLLQEVLLGPASNSSFELSGNPSLTSFTANGGGINGFYIYDNENLETIFLNGLRFLDGHVHIFNNPNLINFSCNSNGGYEHYIYIYENPLLENIDINLSGYLPTIKIYENASLSNLGNIEVYELDRLKIYDNPILENIEGLVINSSIYDLEVTNNPLLQDCCLSDFEKVTVLTLENNATGCNSIEEIIDDCDNVTLCDFQNDITLSSQAEVDAFDCETISGNLTIQGDDITNLDGLLGITNIGGNLSITNNPNLSDCCSIPCWIYAVQGEVTIQNNAEGCNGLINIQESCESETNCGYGFISAFVFYDVNANGIFDVGDYPLNNQTISINPNPFEIYGNTEGLQVYLVENNASYELTWVDNGLWTTTNSSYTVNPETNTTIQYNFPLIPTTDIILFDTDLNSNATRCGFDVNFWLSYENSGTNIANGLIQYEPDELVSFLNADPAPDYEEDGILYWNYEDLLPSEQQQIYMTLQMPGVDNIGDIIESEGFVYAFSENNDTLAQSKFTHSSEITCAYDPNDKLVTPEGLGNQNYTLLTDSLYEYTIRFQNTGNDTAFNVRIEDYLDSDFDWNSFDVISSSHEVRTILQAETGLVTFLFDNIYLPDSNINEPLSHGFVKYEIFLKENLTVNTTVENTANIYFDFNPAIVTNTTVNTLVESYPIFIANVDLKVFLEGAYNPSNQMMKTTLQDLNLLPLFQPYNVVPYNYQGLESVATASDLPNNIVDWVLIEARGGTPNLIETSTTITETNAGFLLSDGSIVGTNGNPMVFRNLEFGTPYHFVVRHRNHLDIISKEAIVADDQMTYDFTTNIDQAFGATQQKLLANGKAALFVGDYVQDGVIQITDYDVWKDDPAQNNVYSIIDGTLDGVVQNTDADAWRPNKAKIGVVEIRF